MPCLKLIRAGEIIHTILGFDEFGGTDDFKTKDVVAALGQHGMISIGKEGMGVDDASDSVEAVDDFLDLDDFD